MVVRVITDSFAYLWDLFPTTGLPHPSLISLHVADIIVTYYVVGCCPWLACSFLRGDGEHLGKGEQKEIKLWLDCNIMRK